jgi:hypothetical protein
VSDSGDFDFWLGSWTATWGDAGDEGSNTVRRMLNDFVIEERFDGRPGADFRGMSVSAYDTHRKLWLQTWVDDAGNYFALEGRRQGSEMVLLCDRHNGPDRDALFRMRFYDIEADSFNWSWERSDDSGESFTLKWHIAYRRV